jgi:phosphatidylglycerol:prolipoprotein diacylglycerol transferase
MSLGVIPTALHLGPITIHLYGVGLAIAAFVSSSYARRRLVRAGLSVDNWGRVLILVLVAGLLGARIAHVATNWDYYKTAPASIWALWEGGLSSFGGLALAIPVGVVGIRRWWPESSLITFTDTIIPALVAGWALGRVLGPQFMHGGGGHMTSQWFGMEYEGQYGKRVPVPLIQGFEDAVLWLMLLRIAARSTRPGHITGVALLVWGLVRSADEHFLLGQASHSGSLGVQISGVLMALGGILILAWKRQTAPSE